MKYLMALVCVMFWAGSSSAMTLEERLALDLSSYVVVDRNAGFFDVDARRQYLEGTDSEMLGQQIGELSAGQSCQKLLKIPVPQGEIHIPNFYQDNQGWRESVRPFRAFENAVSGLSASHLVSADPYHRDCLIDLLSHWAQKDALTQFFGSIDNNQGWFQIESALFAAALAFSVVREGETDRISDIEQIDDWFVRAATSHLSQPGQPNGTCCNNHFYRRALYAAMIGVMTGDNELFQIGVSAIYSAVSGATQSGALPLEMVRGERAAHYQNFAVMYLVMIANIVERQGYQMYDLNIDGRTLQDLIDFDLAAISDPSTVAELSGNREQWLGYLEQNQYFAWMEIYLSERPEQEIDSFLGPYRPVYNSSLGGHLTLFFYRP